MNTRDFLRNVLADFAFSLSEGASAASKVPGLRGAAASLGASIAAPQKRRDEILARQNEAADRVLKTQQIRQQMLTGQQDQAFKMINALSGSQQPTQTMQGPEGSSQTFEAPIAPINVPGMGNMGIPNRSDVLRTELEKYQQQQRIQANENIRQTEATREAPRSVPTAHTRSTVCRQAVTRSGSPDTTAARSTSGTPAPPPSIPPLP